jgi:O-antigen ligase
MVSQSRQLQVQLSPWVWLTRVAFVLAVALVISRMLMLEILRNPVDPSPGLEAAPLGPGPATGLALDLLCTLPALLVLLRRVVDRRFALRCSWAATCFLLLGIWAVFSTLWAADRFLAIVSSLHWLSAMVLLWSAMQLVDSSLRLRLVGGACLGMLLVLVVTGYYFRLVEWSDLKTAWETNKADILREHQWTADSFAARQFEKRIYNGAPMGFSASPNTYAALLVLLGTVTAGIAIQRIRDGDNVGWAIIPCIAIAAALPNLLWAGSRGAAATAVLAAALLWAIFHFQRGLREHPRKIYWRTLAALLLLAAAIIGHGLYHQTLFHDSLTFRWRYWVGAARLIAAHPLLGVGWENFGPRYLAYRLPIASEEIRDPHNFIVRVIAESGAVGGLFLLAGVHRLAWELTQPPARGDDAPPIEIELSARAQRSAATWRILALASVAILVNFFAAVDLNSAASFILLEAMRMAMLWLLLIVGLAAATLRCPARPQRRFRDDELEYFSDTRPAPWLLYAVLIGLGMFLVHNLIDFALFEFGPMFLFAFLAGAALGARGIGQQPAASSRILPIAVLIAGGAAWVIVTGWVALPITLAESLAHDADNAISENRPDLAATDLQSAFADVPYNGDYAFRLARLTVSQGEPALAFTPLNRAIAANPVSVDYLSMRAELAARAIPPNVALATADFAAAVALDPNNVALHRQFADVLAQFGARADAVREYQMALQKNDGLDPHDTKRLSAVDVAAIRRLADLMK